MSTEPTRDRLLDTAENLFAQHGLQGTSLRAITRAAEVNLAAVNYHFQSKEGLIAAVFERRIQPLNTERLHLLDAAIRVADPPPIEAVLRAFLGPALHLHASETPGAGCFMRLLGRAFAEPGEIKMQVLSQFRPTAERFVDALSKAVPDLPRSDLLWRLHFLIGSLAHVTAAAELIRLMSDSALDPADSDELLQHLTAYAVAGFNAPMTHTVSQKAST